MKPLEVIAIPTLESAMRPNLERHQDSRLYCTPWKNGTPREGVHLIVHD